MKRKVRVTIEASPDHPEILTVQDALLQALDFFNVLTDDTTPNVVWNLTLASTNTPLTVEGEPVDMRTLAGAYSAVEHRVEIVERNFARVASGLNFDSSFPRDKLEIARRILKRTTNGIGATIARFSDEAAIIKIPSTVARRYFAEVEKPAQSLHSYLFSRTARREYGSVEGRIFEIGTDYDYPALLLVESKSGRQIWCRIDAKSENELAETIKAKDAWEHRRIRVRGTLNYDENGKVLRVVDGAVAFIDSVSADIAGIVDRNFTEGYAVAEYLDRLRENEFGR